MAEEEEGDGEEVRPVDLRRLHGRLRSGSIRKIPPVLRLLLARSWFLAIYNDDVYWYRQLSMVFPDLVCFMVRRWYHFKRFKPLECLSMPSAPGRRPARCAAPPSTSCPSIRYVRPSPLSLSLPFFF